MANDARLNIRLPADLYRRAQAVAVGRGFSEMLRAALEREITRRLRSNVRTTEQPSTHIDAASA